MATQACHLSVSAGLHCIGQALRACEVRRAALPPVLRETPRLLDVRVPGARCREGLSNNRRAATDQKTGYAPRKRPAIARLWTGPGSRRRSI